MDHVKGLQNVVENSKNLGAALPNEMKAFSNLFGEVFKDGALTVKEKEYIALGIIVALSLVLILVLKFVPTMFNRTNNSLNEVPNEQAKGEWIVVVYRGEIVQ